MQKQKLEGTQEQSKTTVNASENAFSSLSCKRESSYVIMTGRYTNGPDSISFLVVTLALEDSNGIIVATGSGNIQNLSPYQTKIFTAIAYYEGPYENCFAEVDNFYE